MESVFHREGAMYRYDDVSDVFIVFHESEQNMILVLCCVYIAGEKGSYIRCCIVVKPVWVWVVIFI